MKRINALTIAGTDPSGGAGIQADLKTFSALGAYGCSAITALVAQNTRGVQSVYRIEPDFVAAQLDSVFSDVRIDTTKIGMLAETDIVEAVAERLARYRVANVVLDTVMLAKSGDPLLSASAVETLRQRLLPQVSLITPNLPEAAALLDAPHARTEREMLEQGRALLALGCGAVLMKGGHLDDAESPDWLFTREGEQRFTAPRVQTKNTHGTGCTLSAALAALRPRHADWAATVIEAKAWLSAALAHADSLEVGRRVALEAGACMLLPSIYIDGYCNQRKGSFYPLADYENYRHFYACYRKDEFVPQYARDFVQITASALARQQGRNVQL